MNNIQVDGISFIEHISFKAFNEGIRLKDCIRLQPYMSLEWIATTSLKLFTDQINFIRTEIYLPIALLTLFPLI